MTETQQDCPLTDTELAWMTRWASHQGCTINLAGECGFGRECVGLAAGDKWPDYAWHSADYTQREDTNGDVWTPPDAYHKHPCVAVLGRGPAAERQLLEWLRWFDRENFSVAITPSAETDPLRLLIHGGHHARMVRNA